MTIWLMPDDWIQRMEAFEAAFITSVASIATVRESVASNYSIKRGIATISIRGPLVKTRSRMLDYFGVEHTSYSEIEEQTRSAVSNGAKKIVYVIDSPGGDANGILIGMDAIKNAGVPTVAVGDGYLTSGSYMLASQASEIQARNDLVIVGSVGVARDYFVSSYLKSITNRDSENKRPDPKTEEGVSAIQDELDDFFQPIAERVARGRSTSIEAVKKDYGHGAVMTARTALSKGMIDGIMQSNQPAKPAAKIGATMDPKTLKEEHRSTYDAVFNAGKEAGEKAERDRVCAHLTLADGSGDVATAHKAIVEGDGITATVQAAHLSAAMKRQQRTDRTNDNPPPVNAGGEKGGGSSGGSMNTPPVVNQADAQAIAQLEAKYGRVMVA